MSVSLFEVLKFTDYSLDSNNDMMIIMMILDSYPQVRVF